MKKRKEVKSSGRNVIRWGSVGGNIIVEYKEKLRARYEQLSEEVECLEEEWNKYGEAFRGIAEFLCTRTSGKGVSSRDRNQVWWTEEVVKAVCEKKEVWKRIENIKDRGGSRMQGCCICMGRRRKQPVELWIMRGMIWKSKCTTSWNSMVEGR